MTPVVIGFGSNLGDRERFIERALALIARGVKLTVVSSLYDSAPMYVIEQPAYINGVALGETDLGPQGLLALLKAVEAELGRKPGERNGPREIDLDLLGYGALMLKSQGPPSIELPHPRMAERRFVLEPLAEVAPELRLPGLEPVPALLRQPNVARQDVKRIVDAKIRLPGGR